MNTTRRTLVASGTSLVAAGVFGSLSTAATEHDEDDELAEDGSEYSPVEESTSWSSYAGTVGNTGAVPADGAFPEPETVAWEHDDSGHVAIADGRVYLRSENSLYALDDGDGSVVWTADDVGTEGGVRYGTPAVADETVVIGGDRLTALDADSGETRWSQEFDTEEDEAVTSPTVAFDTVFVVADEALHAFELADGSLRWSRESIELDPPEDSDLDDSQDVAFVSTPAVSNEFVYAGVGHDDPAGVAALDVNAGETQWAHAIEEETRRYAESFNRDILATENRVYTRGGDVDQGLQYPVLDSRTGEEATRENASRTRPAVTDEIRVATGRSGFSVENHETDEGWSKGGDADGWSHTDAWGQPAIAGEILVIPYQVNTPEGDENDGIYGFELEDGTERWQFTHADVDGTDVWATHGFVVSGESIYVTGGDQLQVLRPEDQEQQEEGGEEDEEQEQKEGGEEDEEQEQKEGGEEDEEQEADDQPDDSDSEGRSSDEEPSEDDEADDGVDETPGDDTAEDADDDVSDAESTEEADDADTGDDDDTDEADEDDTDDDDEEEDDIGTDDGGAEADEGDEDVDESDDTAGDTDDSDDTDDADGVPGFTTGAGILGGVLGLEWMRRQARTDKSDENR
ncbi:outer membrane protein assembly factor BamB family protein [Natronococcus roseus]|uniref:outer membrane protein assembly factor BamB family protein n=1 Tax=Natronococcus roseus TaxID=1052014 RepID=UPI00374CAEBF